MTRTLIATIVAAGAIYGLGAFESPCPGVVEPPTVEPTDTCVYPGDFISEAAAVVDFSTLDHLPESIRAKLDRYLEARLGRQFMQQLRFREGSYMDPALTPDLVEDRKSRHRQFVAYVLIFDTPFLDQDAKAYCAGVHLDPMGEVVMDIGLPRIALAPQKAQIISRDQALAAARRERLPMHRVRVELEYEPYLDTLVWQVSHASRARELTTCNIDAHTGKFLGWRSSIIVY